MNAARKPSSHARSSAQACLQPLACGLLLGVLFACGGEVEQPAPLARADLALVQRVDASELADGDAEAFARADQSMRLLSQRRPGHGGAEKRWSACRGDPRVQLGLVSFDACMGAELFFREDFAGNGRSCASCHPVNNNFTLDAEFIAGLPDTDPLFVAEYDPELAELERSDLLRDHALVLVNPDGHDAPTERFVMRSVSHTFSLETSITPGPVLEGGLTPDSSPIPPLQRTGWSGDGAPGDGSLKAFAIGAITQHATRSLARRNYRDFVLPSDNQLRQLEVFQRGLGRKNELELTEIQLSDPRADFGRRNFLFGPARSCEDCHRNGGANNVVTPGLPDLANSNFDVGTELDRLELLDELNIPYDGGFGGEPFDTDRDGVADSSGNGRFNSQPLIEAADTPPYFHTNSAATIEDAVRFYTTPGFGHSPAGQAHSPGKDPGPFLLQPFEVEDLGRFFRVLNAAFNCQLALARLQAALQINQSYANRYISIQRGLLRLAVVEMDDALTVLGEVAELNVDASDLLRQARGDIEAAVETLNKHRRIERTQRALEGVAAANDALGTGMTFQIGESTLLF